MAEKRAAFPAVFDEEAFGEDLAHVSAAGRVAATDARRRFERDGIEVAQLSACEAEGRDGTELGGCVKCYLPAPDGKWGMVFDGAVDEEGGPVLYLLAFGLRHPRRPWHPSVYEVADRRLRAGP